MRRAASGRRNRDRIGSTDDGRKHEDEVPKAGIDIAADKAALRERLGRKRLELSADEVRAASQAICDRLGRLPALATARRIALYAAVRGEIALALFARATRARGCELYYPRIERDAPPTLAFSRVDDPDSLVPGRFEVPAPPEDAPARPLAELDLAIVPALAFDAAGHRLGYGRGYYDHALAAAPSVLRIGVCHSFQLIDALPRREADEPVDLIVTPDGARATLARPAIFVEGLS